MCTVALALAMGYQRAMDQVRKEHYRSFLNITENRAKIMSVILAMVRDFEVAEDLFQETVLQILEVSDRFDPAKEFVPWACGIARNMVRRYWRRQKTKLSSRAQELLDDLAQIVVDEGDTDVWRKEQAALRRCLEKVPERTRTLFVLRYGHNCKGQELAQRAQFHAGSIRTTLARLRQQLRQCIDLQVKRPELYGD
jgi:RNA polymerase sigma-70 factor